MEDWGEVRLTSLQPIPSSVQAVPRSCCLASSTTSPDSCLSLQAGCCTYTEGCAAAIQRTFGTNLSIITGDTTFSSYI